MTYPLCWIRRRHQGGSVCADCGVTEEDAGRIAFSEAMQGHARAYEWRWTDLRLLDVHR